jgi:hypothetical protein
MDNKGQGFGEMLTAIRGKKVSIILGNGKAIRGELSALLSTRPQSASHTDVCLLKEDSGRTWYLDSGSILMVTELPVNATGGLTPSWM